MLPSPEMTLAFIGAALLVLVAPGPGVAFVVGQSLGHGTRAGLAAACGLSSGVFVHVIAMTIGLAAVVETSATAFNLLRWAGAAWLVWLGVQALRESGAAGVPAADPSRPGRRRLFVEGFLVSALNPKIAVFFVAFLPQFIDAGASDPALQIAGLGTLYALLALATDGGYAVMAGRATRWFAARPDAMRHANRVTGVTLIGLGAASALVDRR